MSYDTYFELPAPEVFGPQGVHVVALIDRARRLTLDEARALAPVWDDAEGAAREAALAAAEEGAALDDALDAVRDAAGALVVRDVITADHYNTLTRAWREVIGPIHPDDPDIRRAAR